jgi:hypothetical protein
MIQIRLEECPLEISHKLQVISARSFKELQIIESNSYIHPGFKKYVFHSTLLVI